MRAKALEFKPDLVLLSVVGNDTELPNFIRKKHDYFTWKKSFLATFVGERFGWIDTPPAIAADAIYARLTERGILDRLLR